MTVGTLLLFAFVALMTSIAIGVWLSRTWLALTIAATGAGLGAALMVLLGATDWEWRSGISPGGEPLHLRLDGLSALFLVVLCVVGGAGAVYSREYWSDHHYPASAPRGRMWWSALVSSMGLVLTVSNGLHFLIAWELFAICAYFTITLDRQQREARAAGWLYLAASHAGTLCLFAFFALLAARTGSWDLGPMRDQAGLAPLFWLALFGFGVKAGFFPLHIWLPSAHANSPSHVSAILSGVAIKMGLYGIVRFSGWLPVPLAAGWVVIGLGAISALFGIAFALAQNDFKRLLAYCSVENMGVIMIGLGCALLAVTHGDAPWGRLALAGAFLHVWNHAAFKSLLFFDAGSVLHATGTREMSRLGGLWRTMPWTAGLFALGAIAVSGLPPLNGFVSEFLIYLGLFDATTSKGASVWATMPAAIMLAMAGALALASFLKAGAMLFLGAPRTQAAEQAHECGNLMRGPMLALAGICAAIGLAPVVFWPAVARAVGEWHPAWVSVEAPVSLSVLGSLQAALAILAVTAAASLWRKVRANGQRRGLTWDCGFRAPTARMQYTSGSFAGIAAGWFVWFLRPERKLRRPRGLFPAEAIRLERVPETVLERIITPVSVAILQSYTAVRRLQHGSLQSYILYVLGGLVALALLVLLGGQQ
ncbi:MAG TPA: proton-conducting transporter membrane subunit [Candidatus Saccharimonadales bacterium]|nr:proton-conducting transporter membrane subunit [Candidatus Saccharimonadales bacterium]